MYGSTGTKSGSITISDKEGQKKENIACDRTVTVVPAPVCDPNVFSLSATPSAIYANYNSSDVSEAATITVAAGSCFGKTVRFALPKDARIGGEDVRYEGAPTALTPAQFGTGISFTVRLKNKNKPVPNGSYFPVTVCADSKDNGAVSCDMSVNLSLEVTDTPPPGRGGKALPLPVFEEF